MSRDRTGDNPYSEMSVVEQGSAIRSELSDLKDLVASDPGLATLNSQATARAFSTSIDSIRCKTKMGASPLQHMGTHVAQQHEGNELLAHELTHVVQQKKGRG